MTPRRKQRLALTVLLVAGIGVAVGLTLMALQENINQQSDFGLWMRDNRSYVNVGEVLPDLSLLDVRVF